MHRTTSPSSGRERRALIQAMARSLRRHGHVLVEHPERLWQQVYADLQWDEVAQSPALMAERARRTEANDSPWLWVRSPLPESPELLYTCVGHLGWVRACAFSHDGTWVASVGTGRFGSEAGEDVPLRIWDARTGRERLALRGQHKGMAACAISPDDTLIVAANGDKTLTVWDAQTGHERLTFGGHHTRLHACAFSPDGSLVVSSGGGYDVETDSTQSELKVWEASTGHEVATLAGHDQGVTRCAFSPDGSALVSLVGRTTQLKFWDAATFEELTTSRGHRHLRARLADAGVRVEQMSRDGVMAVLRDEKQPGVLAIWDVWSDREKTSLRGNFRGVDACVMSRDGTTIGLISWDDTGNHQTLTLWDGRSGRQFATLQGHTSHMDDCAFSPDGTVIVSASWDQTVKAWEVRAPHRRELTPWRLGSISTCAFSPDGTQVVSADHVTADYQHQLKVWDTRTTRASATFGAYKDRITSCAFSPDGAVIVSAGSLNDNSLRLWQAKTGRGGGVLAPHAGPPWAVKACAFSPDGTRIVAGFYGWSDDKSYPPRTYVRIWNARTYQQLPLGRGTDHNETVEDIAFHPVSNVCFTTSWDNTLKVWDATHARLRGTLRGHTDRVDHCMLSPDGATLVSGSQDHTLILWDWQRFRARAALRGHTDHISACTFSPDGRYVGSVCCNRGRDENNDHIRTDDLTIKLWDTHTGQLQRVIAGHTDGITGCAFTPDGRVLLTTSWDRTLRAWDVATGQELASFVFPGFLTRLARHPWLPMVACGDTNGHIYFADLMGIARGPVIVTARKQRSGLTVSCPQCRHHLSGEMVQIGRQITCPHARCGLRLQINPFLLMPVDGLMLDERASAMEANAQVMSVRPRRGLRRLLPW